MNWEQILEKWEIFLILLAVLFWIYKIALLAIDKVIKVLQDKHKLEIDIKRKESEVVIKWIKKIVEDVNKWDNEHKEAHEVIWKKVDSWFHMVHQKFDKGHRKLDDILSHIKK